MNTDAVPSCGCRTARFVLPTSKCHSAVFCIVAAAHSLHLAVCHFVDCCYLVCQQLVAGGQQLLG